MPPASRLLLQFPPPVGRRAVRSAPSSVGGRSCVLSHGRACPAWACRQGGPGGRSGLASRGLVSGKVSFGRAGFGRDGGSHLRLTLLGLGVRLLYGRMFSFGPVPLCAEKQGLNNYAGINDYRIVRH